MLQAPPFLQSQGALTTAPGDLSACPTATPSRILHPGALTAFLVESLFWRPSPHLVRGLSTRGHICCCCSTSQPPGTASPWCRWCHTGPRPAEPPQPAGRCLVFLEAGGRVGLGVQATTAGLPHPVSQSLELGDTPARIWHLGMGAGRHSRSHEGSTSPHGDTRHRASTGLCSHNWGTAQHGLGRIRPSLQAWCGVAAVPLLGVTAMGTRARGAVEPLGWLPAPSPWLFATQCRLHSW